MVGATTPLFTVALSVLATGKKYNKYVYLSMIPLCVGIMLTVTGELNFDWWGLFFLIISTLTRAAKSIVQDMLLSSREERLDSMNLLFYMSPVTVVFLALSSFISEGEGLMARYPTMTQELWHVVWLGGLLSFLLNLLNLMVTEYTNAVTQQVLGNVKVVVSIVVSVLIFQNSVGWASALGCCVTLAGVATYGVVSKWKDPSPLPK
eukprot:Colp12_sorted_trinity150504_noHs@30045